MIRIEEIISDEVYSKIVKVFGIKVYSVVKSDKSTPSKKEPQIGFQTMNNILDHYPDV